MPKQSDDLKWIFLNPDGSECKDTPETYLVCARMETIRSHTMEGAEALAWLESVGSGWIGDEVILSAEVFNQ